MKIPVVIQHRHVHLSEQDAAALFGDGYEFTSVGGIGHRGQYVYKETVTIVGKNGHFEHVRVLGPHREQTQVELSASDAHAIGINAPVRLSGDLSRSGSCTIRGVSGELKGTYTTIIPARHLHCGQTHAKELGLTHDDVVHLAPHTRPETRIEHVTVRVHPTFSTELHITSDEAAEFWLQGGDHVILCE